MLEVNFESSVSDALGNIELAVLQANIVCSGSSPELRQLMDATIAEKSSTYNLQTIKLHPVISEGREAYRKTGADPSRYRLSAESLLRRIVKGRGFDSVNNAVDILNLISINSGYSISGFDVVNIKGDIKMGIGTEKEIYYGIGRGMLNIHKLPVLRDNLGAIGCPTSDSERTMIGHFTNEIVFIFYNFNPEIRCDIIIDECRIMLEKFCSAKNIRICQYHLGGINDKI